MSVKSVIDSDLSIFFNTNEFGIEVTLVGGTKINVIADFNPIASFGIENAEVVVTAKYSDVSGLVHDDTMTINGVIYKSKTTPRDESGISTIELSKD